MGNLGKQRGRRVLCVVVMVAGLMATQAPPAAAHGVHGAEAVALFEPAGPFVVSVFLEDMGGGELVGHATVTASQTEATPQVLLHSTSGVERPLALRAAEARDGWVGDFVARTGDTLILVWDTTTDGRLAIGLVPVQSPWWFTIFLGVITPPALWFVHWLMKRRRQVFGLAPAH